MDIIRALLKIPAFWTALFGFISALTVYLAPDLPKDVTASGLFLLGVIASYFTGSAVVTVLNKAKEAE